MKKKVIGGIGLMDMFMAGGGINFERVLLVIKKCINGINNIIIMKINGRKRKKNISNFLKEFSIENKSLLKEL